MPASQQHETLFALERLQLLVRDDTVDQYESVRLDVSSLRKLVEASEIWLTMDAEDSRTKARLTLGILDGLARMVGGLGALKRPPATDGSGASPRAAVAVRAMATKKSSGKFQVAVRRFGRCALVTVGRR